MLKKNIIYILIKSNVFYIGNTILKRIYSKYFMHELILNSQKQKN